MRYTGEMLRAADTRAAAVAAFQENYMQYSRSLCSLMAAEPCTQLEVLIPRLLGSVSAPVAQAAACGTAIAHQAPYDRTCSSEVEAVAQYCRNMLPSQPGRRVSITGWGDEVMLLWLAVAFQCGSMGFTHGLHPLVTSTPTVASTAPTRTPRPPRRQRKI